MNNRSILLSLKNRTRRGLSTTSHPASSGFVLFSMLLMLISFSSIAMGQAPPPKWKQGDVFVGVGGGNWKVYRPSIATFVDTVSDGVSSAGANNGSALDNTWHLIGTDSGSGSNVSKIVRFSISPHDPGYQVAPPVVLSTLDGSTGTGSKNPQAVVVGSGGGLIVANASPATIAVFSPAGSLVKSFALSNQLVDRALASADLSSDGNSLFYTSGGSTVRKLLLTGTSVNVTTFASIGGKRFFGIRVVKSCTLCASGAGILVAAQGTVYLLDGSSGSVVKQYTVSGQNDLKVLAIDPVVKDQSGNIVAPDFFWVGSPTSGSFFQVNFSSGAASTAIASGASGVFALATYAGFNAAQPVPTEFAPGVVTSSPSTSQIFSYTNGTDIDKLTLTGYGTAFSTNASVFASSVDPATGTSDNGLPCTPTVGGLCTIWEIDVDSPLPTGALMAMKIISTLSPIPISQTLLNKTSLLRNELEDVTTGVTNQDPIGASRFSVYSLNNRNTAEEGCTYFSPVVDGTTLNNPGNITFRFQCTGLPGAQLHTLSPRISIVQLAGSAAPQPFFPGITDLTGGTCCTVAKYRYDAQSNTWVINVSFSGVNTSTSFVATTFDDNHIASAFGVRFTVSR